MKLLSNHLLAERLTAERIGRIVLPESLKDDANVGGPKLWRVLGVGPGRRNKKGHVLPIECAPGDRILTHSYTTGPMELPGGRAILTDDQILAVFPRKEVAL